MKKINLLLTILSLSYNVVQGGVVIKKRKNCAWENQRYNVYVETRKLTEAKYSPRHCRATDARCHVMAMASCETDYTSSSFYSPGAKAVGWFGPGGPGGQFIDIRWGYTAGAYNNYKLKNILPNFSRFQTLLDSGYLGTKVRDSLSDVIFNSVNRTIIVKDFYLKMFINEYDISQQFISITLNAFVNNNTDSATYLLTDSVFKSINIYLQGNVLSLNGINSNLFVQTHNENDKVGYTFSGSDLIIQVPENINFDNLGFEIIADARTVENQNAPEFATSNKINVLAIKNIYPNPASDVININIGSEKNKVYRLTIIDNLGREVYVNNSLHIEKGDNITQINMSSFKSGNYILILTKDEERYQWQFVKE